ncbi:MAG: SDR family NAD(P)-dependent oxidoreductase [Solirubrobacteraceae bacterium]
MPRGTFLGAEPRRVLLLGGTSEIGLAILGALADAGPVELALLGRDEGGLARAAKSLADRGREPRHVSAGLSIGPERHAELIERAADALGGIDVVVLAVGALGDGEPLSKIDRDVELLDVNVRFAGSLMLHATAALASGGAGTLVVLSSAAAIRARRSNPVYGASKAGLDALARSLGDAFSDRVHVLVVRPGFVRTRMTSGMTEPPLACSKEDVAAATLRGIRRKASVVWAPPAMRWAMLLLGAMPRAVYRRLPL